MDNPESQFKPIPDMVLSPEERQAFEQTGDSKLPGAPEKIYESALVARELGANLPALENVGADLDRFSAITQNEKQKIMVREKFRQFYQNPQSMEEYFDVLRILQETGSDYSQSAKIFSEIFEDQFDKMAARIESYSPEILGKWLNLSVKSPLYKKLAEKLLRLLFEKARTMTQTMGLLYAFALATLKAGDPMVFKRGVEILNYGSDIFPIDSLQHQNFILALFANDDLLQKQIEVDAVRTRFGLKHSPGLFHRASAYKFEPDFEERIDQAASSYKERDPEKYKKLTDFFSVDYGAVEAGLGVIKRKVEKPNEFPFNLVHNPGPLRKLFNELLEKELETAVVINLPGVGEAVYEKKPQEKLNENILEALRKSAIKQKPPLLSKNRDTKCVLYLTPELSHAQKEKLGSENLKLREDILRDRMHSVSPRGDKMITADKSLRPLAIKSISFSLSEPKTILQIDVEVGDFFFRLQLNPELNLEEFGTAKALEVPFEQRAFLEHVILSHLKELQCTERIKHGTTEPRTRQEKLEREKEFSSRRGHIRLLPPGQKYSLEAFQAGLQEQGWDLVKMNAEAGKTLKSGMYTYVKIQESIKIPGQPIVSRAPHAMDVFHENIE